MNQPRRSSRFKPGALMLAAVLLLLALALPLYASAGFLNLTNKMLIAAVFALGFNLLWGQAGLISFGHAAYFGIGTFASIYAMKAIEAGFGLPSPLVPLAGALAGFLVGLLVGWFATQRSGVYFAMITVALAELISAVATKWESVFGGEAGVRSVRSSWGPFALQGAADVYYVTAIWALVVLLALWGLQRSPIGLVIRGLRERETRVAFLGYHTHFVKTLVFAISCSVASLAGGLLAFSDESASMVLFHGADSAFVVINTVIGGAGVLLGPVVGAFLTTSFGYYVANLTNYSMLYLGLLFVSVVLFAPNGLVGGLLAHLRLVRAGERPLLADRSLLVAAGTLLIVAGSVLLIEIVGRLCTPEYGAGRTAGQAWPAVRVLWHDWQPASPLTWCAVLLPLLAGGALVRLPAATAGAWRRLSASSVPLSPPLSLPSSTPSAIKPVRESKQ